MSRAGVAFLLAIGIASAQTPAQKPAPVQPIPFSHKAHAGKLKLACATCHPNPDPGELMTIAAAVDCMRCHDTVKSESAAIRKLAAFAKNGRDMRWARVGQLPSNIIFSHKDHLKAGGTCAECHGPVAEREQLAAEKDLSMAGCMSCHRARRASLDCNYCHDQPTK